MLSAHRYIGRGITVCDRWLVFENFLADMGEPPAVGLTLERKNNDGNYEPDNCVWATRKQQHRNRTGIHLITYQGRTQCLKDWAAELGMNYASLRWRLIRQGWPVEEAFTWTKHKIRAKRRERARNEYGQWAPDSGPDAKTQQAS